MCKNYDCGVINRSNMGNEKNNQIDGKKGRNLLKFIK